MLIENISVFSEVFAKNICVSQIIQVSVFFFSTTDFTDFTVFLTTDFTDFTDFFDHGFYRFYGFF